MGKKYLCEYCGKRFKTEQGAQDHMRDVHALPKIQEAHVTARKATIDNEPSMADLTIEAFDNKAAGLPYEKWLLGE